MSVNEISGAPRVVYVYGTGRNGSTLLGQLLGSQRHWFHGGEIKAFWWEGMLENRICECGARFRECEFWSAVVAESGATRAEALNAAEEFRASCRTRHVPRVLIGKRWPSRESELRFGDRVVRLYQAIARVSGASVIVDTSKTLTYGALVSTAFDTFGLYMVRDPRAVAYSYEHAKVDPSRGDAAMMPKQAGWRSALDWQVYEMLAPRVVKRFARDGATLRYEDMVAMPERIVAEIRQRVDGGSSEAGALFRGMGHTISGNPIRFQAGPVDIRTDERWLRDRSLRRELMVEWVCWPGMVTRGYPLEVTREGVRVR